MSLQISRTLNIKSIIIVLTIFIVARSSALLFIHTMKIKHSPPYPGEPGSQFSDFKTALYGIKEIGYFSDRNKSPENNDGSYLQAQYFLSPTIIKPDNKDADFFIIDSWNYQFILQIIVQNKLKRITNNEFGQGLFKRIGR